jgi:hypothetical protein
MMTKGKRSRHQQAETERRINASQLRHGNDEAGELRIGMANGGQPMNHGDVYRISRSAEESG